MFPYYALAALVQVVWSLTPSASRVVLDYFPVETYTAIRYSISGVLFLAVALWRGRPPPIAPRDLVKLAALGIATYGLASLGTLYGLSLGGVLNFSLASSLNATVTAVVAVIVLGERVRRGFFVALPLSIGGSLILAAGKVSLSGARIAVGSLALIVGAYVCEALGLVFSRRYRDKLPLPWYLALLQLSGASFMWGVAAATGRLPPGRLALPPIAWASLAFVSLVACAGCFGAQYWLLRRIDGHRLAFFDAFHTAGSAALGVLLFGERGNPAMAVGGALLISGLVAVNWRADGGTTDARTPSRCSREKAAESA